MKYFLLLAAFLVLSPKVAFGNTITAASCSQSDVQNAINSASLGDTVLVPGGTCTWSSTVTIPTTKGIILDGQRTTTIQADGAHTSLKVTANSSFNILIRGFTFVGSGGTGNCDQTNSLTLITNGNLVSPRVYNNTFTETGNGVMLCVETINNTGPALFDHNTFSLGSGGGGAEIIHVLGNAGSGWGDDVVPGSSNMVFLEDNTFTYTPPTGFTASTAALQSYFGARTVFRHNTIHNMHVDQHGSCGQVWVRWWEIYNNTFFTDVNQPDLLAIRGGTGVVWGNHQSGNNSGANTILLEEECSGTYPIIYQLGRGLSQNLSPAYIWGNDAQISVIGTATYVILNRDYFLSGPNNLTRCESAADVSTGCPVTYNYVPYTYPHPLQGTSPSPPSNLTVVIH